MRQTQHKTKYILPHCWIPFMWIVVTTCCPPKSMAIYNIQSGHWVGNSPRGTNSLREQTCWKKQLLSVLNSKMIPSSDFPVTIFHVPQKPSGKQSQAYHITTIQLKTLELSGLVKNFCSKTRGGEGEVSPAFLPQILPHCKSHKPFHLCALTEYNHHVFIHWRDSRYICYF